MTEPYTIPDGSEFKFILSHHLTFEDDFKSRDRLKYEAWKQSMAKLFPDSDRYTPPPNPPRGRTPKPQ